MELEKQFITEILDDLNENRLVLPSLPEIALRVRKAVDNPAVSAAHIAKIINTDPALSARLLKVVNSVAYRGQAPTTSIQGAVTRLGADQVRNLVTTLVMEQLYQAKHTRAIKQQLRALWRHSTRVAALSYVLAKRATPLAPDEALIAGLVHDIGALPVLTRASQHPALLEDEQALQRVVRRLHNMIGPTILEDWGFPQPLVAVAAEHEDLWSKREGPPDLVDVVIVANLHARVGRETSANGNDWNDVPAFAKLDLSPDRSLELLDAAQEELAQVKQILAA